MLPNGIAMKNLEFVLHVSISEPGNGLYGIMRVWRVPPDTDSVQSCPWDAVLPFSLNPELS